MTADVSTAVAEAISPETAPRPKVAKRRGKAKVKERVRGKTEKEEKLQAKGVEQNCGVRPAASQVICRTDAGRPIRSFEIRRRAGKYKP